jgi:xylonate dehydratase
LEGTVNLVGPGGVEDGTRILAERDPHPDLQADPALPDDTRLWAALQDASGGPWGGAVYDVDAIIRLLEAGKRALRDQGQAAAVRVKLTAR